MMGTWGTLESWELCLKVAGAPATARSTSTLTSTPLPPTATATATAPPSSTPLLTVAETPVPSALNIEYQEFHRGVVAAKCDPLSVVFCFNTG